MVEAALMCRLTPTTTGGDLPREATKRVRRWGSSTGDPSHAPSPPPNKKKLAVEKTTDDGRRAKETTTTATTSSDGLLSSQSSNVDGLGGGVNDPSQNYSETGKNRLSNSTRSSGGAKALHAHEEAPETMDGPIPGDLFPCTTSGKMELKIRRKAVPGSLATSVPNLLSTGLLEGLPVKYMYRKHNIELPGIISGIGYSCGCSSCNYNRVLSALEFEKHADTASKNQNNHIFLENGKSLYTIVKELQNIPLDFLGKVIEHIIGCEANFKQYEAWKESFQRPSHEANKTCRNDHRNHQPQSELHNETHSVKSSAVLAKECCSGPTSEFKIQDSYNNEIFLASPLGDLPMNEKCSVTQERSKSGRQNAKFDSSSSARSHSASAKFQYLSKAIMYPNVQQKRVAQGGDKKRDNNLHRLIFTENGLPDGCELAYYSKGKKVLEGYKLGNGILCSCCNREISPSQFEAHAGWATRRQPYRHIYTSNGMSLHELSISLSEGEKLNTICHDGQCTICGHGENLIICNQCPRAFHTACLDLPSVSDGELFCPHCKKNNEYELNSNDTSSVAKPIALRVRHIVNVPTSDVGGCVICRSNHFSQGIFNEETVMLCDQCEKEYHVGCLKNSNLCDLKELPKGKWFCCKNCDVIHTTLQNMIYNGSKIIDDLLLSERKTNFRRNFLTTNFGDEAQFQLLSGQSQIHGKESLLSMVAVIFQKGFDPIVERSGRDLVPAMIYSKAMTGQDFGGMYCATIIVRSVVVSAGIIRIFGTDVAELPLIATRKESQGKGYFRYLFSCIESLLMHLKVESLILPATKGAESMWIDKLGFHKLAKDQILKYAKELPILIFNGSTMLGKSIFHCRN